ncbi:MAG: hypothetical protein O6940_03785 [Ignavibacteria bacterium]|nr:hypothetical protein [Ignavibacteria bacterium]
MKQFFFNMQEDGLFNNAEQAFFREATNDESCMVTNIEGWIESSKPEDELLHLLAENIRLEIIECNDGILKDIQHSPYVEVLSDAIYTSDSFKIAKEIYRQYNSKVA